MSLPIHSSPAPADEVKLVRGVGGFLSMTDAAKLAKRDENPARPELGVGGLPPTGTGGGSEVLEVTDER